MYRNSADFCLLILYSAALLSPFILTIFGIFRCLYNIISFANSDSITASFLIWMPF